MPLLSGKRQSLILSDYRGCSIGMRFSRCINLFLRECCAESLLLQCMKAVKENQRHERRFGFQVIVICSRVTEAGGNLYTNGPPLRASILDVFGSIARGFSRLLCS